MTTNLKKGQFRAKGVEAALGMSSNNKEQVAVRLAFLDDGYIGVYRTWYGYFTPETIERTLESLRLLGWQGDDLFDLKGIGDTEVIAVLDEETYEGKTQLKVKWINAPGGGLALKAPMNDQQAKAFSARMKGNVLAHKQKGAVATTPVRSSNNRPQDDTPPPRDEDFGF